MEEPLPVHASSPDASQPAAMCLAARLLNVFAIPGEVFEVVKASRFRVENWLVPALLLAGVGILSVFFIVSQPAIQKNLSDLRAQATKASAEQVQAGKLTQADARLIQIAAPLIADPVTLKALGSVAAVLLSIAQVFWWAFVLWLLGRRYLKVQFGYLKALEVAGLALMIAVLGGLVRLLLMVNLPQVLSSGGTGLVVADFDAILKSRVLLGAALLFALWLVGVLSVGLARLTGVPFVRAAWFVFAFWLIQESLFMLLLGAAG